MPEIGERAPDFCLPDKDEKESCLKDFKDRWVVLYFYPRDNTPGCTTEAVQFTVAKREFRKENAVIIGVSKDSPASHCRFAEKRDLAITLLSDVDHEVIEKYDAWKAKKLYGREFLGTVRTTYLVDPDGKIAHIWKKVRVKGHVEAVLDKLIELRYNGSD